MGIANLKELVDKGEPISQQEIDAAQAEHFEIDRTKRYTRVEVEQTFVENREEIEAKYQKALQVAEDRRVNAHSRNVKRRTAELDRVGLNPNGSDPQGRKQDVL